MVIVAIYNGLKDDSYDFTFITLKNDPLLFLEV